MHANETTQILVSLIASAGFLAIAALAASRGRRDPLAWQLAILCVDLFIYDFSELAHSYGWATVIIDHRRELGDLSLEHVWDWINNATGSLAPALFYHFVVVFVGRRNATRPAIIAAYIYFGTLSLISLSPFLFRFVFTQYFAWVDHFQGNATWAMWMLFGLGAVMSHGAILLGRHFRGAATEEKARTRLVIATVLIAGIANITDLADLAGVSWSPHLGSWGLVVSALVLAAVALRVRMFEGLSFLTAVNAVAIALVVVLAEVAVFRYVGDRIALAGAGTVVVTLGALLAARFVVTDYAAARERMLAHATLGRMAAQMAHDIKNPLASIRGASQFLAGEREAGRSIDEQNEFLDLLVAQCDRITRIVDQYQRIGQAKPVLDKTDVNEAAREAVKFLASANVESKLADALPACDTDRDLLVIALENLVRNAHEAASDRTVHVETGVVADTSDRAWVFIAVRDEGPGMDPRTRERALEGFFTTKAQGSGLGLAFVRRVVEAHRGKLLVDSHEGEGTTVRIELRASA